MPLGGLFDRKGWGEEIARLQGKQGAEGFWNDSQQAAEVNRDLKNISERLARWEALRTGSVELAELWELVGGGEGAGADDREQLERDYTALAGEYEELRVAATMNGQYDSANCYIGIQSGAGGTESCDWVQMLLRMYMRWCERRGLGVSVLYLQEAEGGVKSVTIEVSGEFAYGYLRGEHGIHRLVRISPFDSSGRRHTTFAAVEVSPHIVEDIAKEMGEIKPDELRIDTYRASGAGGQHVNKTDSAVRMTHLPTGIVVQCQNERSQHRNKETALGMLRSRLYCHYQEQADKRRSDAAGEKRDISWGNQIRSYVFHPYTMVKDHRFACESGNIEAIMDGNIDEFINGYLRSHLK